MEEAPVAYLPLGTLEWHGEHMPLGADGLQSRHFFELLARECGGVVMPMLFLGPDTRTPPPGGEAADPRGALYGMDRCGDNFTEDMRYPDQRLPGSAYWVDDSLFEALLDAVALQAARAGARVLVAHGHGPSTLSFRRRAPSWKGRLGLEGMILWGEREWEEDGVTGFMVDHGGANETSITLHLRPELVDMEALGADLAVRPKAIGMADPRIWASAEKGRTAVEANLERMRSRIARALDPSRGT
jgi:creatinine amidohydrolase